MTARLSEAQLNSPPLSPQASSRDRTLEPWSEEASLAVDRELERGNASGDVSGKTVTTVTKEAARSQAERLVELAQEAEFFVSPSGVPHVTVANQWGLWDTWQVRSEFFRSWLMRRFHDVEHRVPRAQAMTDAVGTLGGKAVLGGKICEVYVRVAPVGNAIFLDLGDPERRVVEIDPEAGDSSRKP